MAETATSEPDADSIMRTRQFRVLLVLAAILGVIASLIAWGFLELIDETQGWVYEDLPQALGFDDPPKWWPVPVLALAGLAVAAAIVRLPGEGGHRPSQGLGASATQPIELPGVLVAGFATIGLGLVLGPEGPLIALGGGLGILAVKLLRPDATPEMGTLVAASGMFAAVSFLFGSPLIAAVILIEASGLGGSRQPLVLVPGLLAAGIGSLVSIGMGSWTGVDKSAISLAPLQLPDFGRPDFVDFLWTIPLAAAIAVGVVIIFTLARRAERMSLPHPYLALPAIGMVVAGLAIAFAELTDKGEDQVLFSGQDALGSLVTGADDWSLSALALVIGFKGLAYALSLSSFRGGPTFPALFLGAAAGLMAAELPGFEITPAVAVGIGAAFVAVLRLPLSAVVVATLLTSGAGLGAGPLVILGVVTAYLVTLGLSPRKDAEPSPAG
jgi:H+/Cl- antiporter ClcA